MKYAEKFAVQNHSTQDIVAIFSHPVTGNPTQYMMEKAVAEAAVDWRFLSCDILPEDLPDAIRGLKVMGFGGVSIGTPHQAAVLEFLDEIDPPAQQLGRVDCVAHIAGRLVGTNHEVIGLIRAIREVLELQNKHVVILGSGALAQLLAEELVRYGAASVGLAEQVAPPEESKAESDANSLTDGDYNEVAEAESLPEDTSSDKAMPDSEGTVTQSGLPSIETAAAEPEAEQRPTVYPLPWHTRLELAGETEVVITTPEAATWPVPELGHLSRQTMVVDSGAYLPESLLLQQARQHELQRLDCWQIFAHRSASCFELWTGTAANLNVLRESMEEFLEL